MAWQLSICYHIGILPKPDQFLRDNAVFFVGSLAVSALNYLYYPLLGRLLTPADFGETQVVISLFLQASVFLTVVTQVAVNVVANQSDSEHGRRTLFEIERLTLAVAATLITVGIFCIPFFERYLHFPSSGPFLLLALSIAISVPLTLRGAYLRGVQAFLQLSISGAIGSSAKIATSFILVFAGLRTLGAVAGLVVAQLVALLYMGTIATGLGYRKPTTSRWFSPLDAGVLRPQARYGMLVLIASFVSTSLLSVDTLAVKHYFSADTAGLYSGAATIAKIIFYVAGSIPTVLLSKVRVEGEPSENRRLLLRSALLTALIAGGAGLAVGLFPKPFLGLLLGSRYEPGAYLLPALCGLSFLLALFALFSSYCLALRQWIVAWVSLAGAALALVLLALFHQALLTIVADLGVAVAVMLISLAAWSLPISRYTGREHA